MVGQVYVEKLEPLRRNSSVPLILVHGDFHTSQVWLTKPDGDPGWASFFVNKGYEVHVLDVPPSGRSCWFDQETLANSPRAHVSVKDVEDYLTAPATQSADCWPTAASHSQWPGSGRRGDPVFDQYYASLNPLHLGRPERQVMARDAVVQLLTEIGPAVLVGEGSGANAAWLAADLDPSRAVGVIAVEPAGPPFGNAFQRREDGKRVYTPSVRYRPGTRAFGISDIPLQFDPPANPDMSLSLDPEDANAERPLDLVNVDAIDGNHSLVLQASAKDEGVTRQLINLKKVKHFVFTGHASFHSVFDATTCLFMEQAGVEVRHITLGAAGILGNGHLMFLKKNSDRLADMVHSCIKLGFQGSQPSRGNPAVSTPRSNGRGQAVALGNSAEKARPTAVISGDAKTASRVSPQKPNSGTRKTAVNSERVGAKRGLPPDSPQEHTPSQTSKKKKRGALTGPQLSQMQQHLQSDHFQRLQQPRPVSSGQDPSRITQPFTASLTRNPAMPAPTNLQAFGEHIPGPISLQLPERRHSAYMDRQGQGEQEHARVPGTSPRSAPSFQIHSLAQPQAVFVRSPLQVQNAMSHGTRSIEAGPVSATGPSATTPLHAMPSPRNMGQGMYNSSQLALDAKTPMSQQGEHRPTGDTTIAMEGAVWQPQSPSTPTRGPRAAAGTASGKKSNTKPKKSVSEAEEDEDYDPATESAKPARSRARGSKAVAAAKKGNKGKNAEADEAESVAPEGEAPKTKGAGGGGKAGQGTAAKNTKKNTKSKNVIAEDHEGDEIGPLPQSLAENEPKPSKSIVIKRKRKQTDIEGDGVEDSTNNETTAGGNTKRARSNAPSPREGTEAER